MWLVLIATSGFLTLAMSLALCLCWKKKHSNSELNGVDGLVLRKKPDENVNHILPSNRTIDVVDDGHGIADRSLLQASRRSLPDIPSEHENVKWGSQIDNSSEHYATVEQYQNSTKRHTLPNGLDIKPSISQQSSLSQADCCPYEKVNYDKIKSQDHPYAILRPTDRSSTVEGNNSNERSGNTPRNLSVANDTNCDIRGGNEEPNSNITAASAVAGGIAASRELPYMTPHVLQTNFSGDSQDSSKGYTSISVREPLANIMAETKEDTHKDGYDPHYATVSDDSDDVYTTIPDPNQIYTSGSETYARIPPTSVEVEAEMNPTLNSSDLDGVYQPIIQPIPPSTESLKTHNQASSSTANMGSPKPEKRQANSPLPLLPVVNLPEEDHKISSPRSIEEMYAKVQKAKAKFNHKSDEDPHENSTIFTYSSTDCDVELDKNGYARINELPSVHNSNVGYENVKRDSDSFRKYEELKNNTSDCENDVAFGYSVVNKKKKENISASCEVNKASEDNVEPNYESIEDSGSKT